MSLVFVQNNMENTKFKVGDKVDKITGYNFRVRSYLCLQQQLVKLD